MFGNRLIDEEAPELSLVAKGHRAEDDNRGIVPSVVAERWPHTFDGLSWAKGLDALQSDVGAIWMPRDCFFSERVRFLLPAFDQ